MTTNPRQMGNTYSGPGDITLSLRQPWAWMVVHGGKRIENRKWSTDYRGPILIHAAQSMTRNDYVAAVLFAKTVEPKLIVPLYEYFAREDCSTEGCNLGGVIGRATIVECHTPCITDGLFKSDCTHPWHMDGQFGFALDHVESLPFRKCRGALGLFRINTQEAL